MVFAFSFESYLDVNATLMQSFTIFMSKTFATMIVGSLSLFLIGYLGLGLLCRYGPNRLGVEYLNTLYNDQCL